MISVLILTKNEAQDLLGCLERVAWSDDIQILDSESSDATVSIAAAFGAKVTIRKFDNYASQRNFALNEMKYRNPWLLSVDADERIPPELATEMKERVLAAGPAIGAFRIQRKDYFVGRWLKHAQISPYYIRLFRLGSVRYEREINEVVKVSGSVEDLANSFDHFPFSKGMEHWIAKHNRYSTMEALRVMRERAEGEKFSVWRAFFAKDFNSRRWHQKGLFMRLPGRPFIKLFYMLIVRGAILDGKAGVRYAVLQSIYEYFICVKQDEIGLDLTRKDGP